ncbi:hypothetical protein JCM19233_290 [Vibrio astriarenae]|nr:hypothetical protein JCM19233_290 [Vibrio sp. C7]
MNDTPCTLAKYVELTLEQGAQNNAETTNDASRSMLNIITKTLKGYLEKRPFSEIRHSDIQTIITNWQKEGKSDKTISNYLAPMRKIFKTATSDGVFKNNPMEGIQNPKQKQSTTHAKARKKYRPFYSHRNLSNRVCTNSMRLWPSHDFTDDTCGLET